MSIKKIAIGLVPILAAAGIYTSSLTRVAQPIQQKPPTQTTAPVIVEQKQEEKVFVSCDEVPLPPWQQFKLKSISEYNGVPYVLALAVIEQESTFDPNAENDGCYGLMQVSQVHAPMEVLLDPIENMRYGCYLLGAWHRKYNDWNKALTCYNYGEAGAAGMWSSSYSRAVLLKSERWAQLLGERSILYGQE